MRRLLAIWAALILPMHVGATTLSAIKPPQIAIGEVRLKLPPPQRLVNPQETAPQIVDLSLTMVTPTNRLLGIYIPEPALRKYLAAGELALERYAMAQTAKSFDDGGETTPEQFASFKVNLKQQSAADLDKIAHRTQAHLEKATKTLAEKGGDKTLKMSITNIKGMGVVSETGTSITTLTSLDYRSQQNGDKEGWPVVAGTTVLVVRGKPLFLYVYSPYRAQTDVKWVTETSMRWKDAIERAN